MGQECGNFSPEKCYEARRALPLSAAGLNHEAPFRPFEEGVLQLSEVGRGDAITEQDILLPNRRDLFQYKDKKEDEEEAEAQSEVASKTVAVKGDENGRDASAAARGASKGLDNENGSSDPKVGAGKQKLFLTLKKDGGGKKKRSLTPEELAEQTLLKA